MLSFAFTNEYLMDGFLVHNQLTEHIKRAEWRKHYNIWKLYGTKANSKWYGTGNDCLQYTTINCNEPHQLVSLPYMTNCSIGNKVYIWFRTLWGHSSVRWIQATLERPNGYGKASSSADSEWFYRNLTRKNIEATLSYELCCISWGSQIESLTLSNYRFRLL